MHRNKLFVLAAGVSLAMMVGSGCGTDEISEIGQPASLGEDYRTDDGTRQTMSRRDVLSMQTVIRKARRYGRVLCRKLPLAAAVATAESGRNRLATNRNGATSGCPNGSTDRGLWQINGCYWGKYRWARRPRVFRARYNAKGMGVISNHGRTFRPWWAYRYGRHKKYLRHACRAYNRTRRKLWPRCSWKCRRWL